MSLEKKIYLNHQILVFVVMLTFSFTANAERVYESTDKEGVVEFSDKPSSGAEVINVEKPNVADTLPAEHVEPSSSASATNTEGAPADSEQLEVIHVGGDDYIDDDETRRERKERMEHRKEVVRQPINKSAKSK